MHFFHLLHVCYIDSCSDIVCRPTSVSYILHWLQIELIQQSRSICFSLLHLNSSTTSSNNQTTNNSSALSPLRTNLPKPNYISEMNSPLIQVSFREVHFPRKFHTVLHGLVSHSNLTLSEYKYRKHSLILYLKSSANASTRLGQMWCLIKVKLFK